VKNITVSVPDEVYRRARVRAAEQGRSLSALVAEFLSSLSRDDAESQRAEFERIEALQRALARVQSFDGSDRLSRDAVHDRALR
jgi:hypothetical protein